MAIVLIVVLVSSVVLFLRTGNDDDEVSSEIMEATLVPSDGDDLDDMTVAELKEHLRSEGLSTSGKKEVLIQRLRDAPKAR